MANKFWDLFTKCATLNFPYPVGKATSIDIRTDQFHFSDKFETSFKDIRNWGMTAQIFHEIQDLAEALNLTQDCKGEWALAPDNERLRQRGKALQAQDKSEAAPESTEVSWKLMGS